MYFLGQSKIRSVYFVYLVAVVDLLLVCFVALAWRSA